MKKQTTTLLFLLLSFSSSSNISCSEIGRLSPASVTIEDIDEEDDELSSTEEEEENINNIEALSRMLREGKSVHLIMNNPTIANQVLQQNLQQELPEAIDPIFQTLAEVGQITTINAGTSFGQELVNTLTTHRTNEKINHYAVDLLKIDVKKNLLKDAIALINTNRMSQQQDIYNELNEKMKTTLDSNTEEQDESENNKSNEELLQFLSMQKSLEEKSLTQHEHNQLCSNINSVLNQITKTLDHY